MSQPRISELTHLVCSPGFEILKDPQMILTYRQVWEPLSQRQQDVHLYRHICPGVHTLTHTHTSRSAPRFHDPATFMTGVHIIQVSEVIWGNKQPLIISPNNTHSGPPPGSNRWAQQSGFSGLYLMLKAMHFTFRSHFLFHKFARPAVNQNQKYDTSVNRLGGDLVGGEPLYY